MYYDPFANLDPDLIKPFKPADKAERKASEQLPGFDPKASEFRPLSKEKNKLPSEEGEGEESRDRHGRVVHAPRIEGEAKGPR